MAPGAAGAPEADPLDAAALAACLRDLTSLLALPALWSGRDAAAVVGTLFEALEAVLPVDACYLERHRDGPDAARVLRAGGRTLADPSDQRWAPFVAACSGQQESVRTAPSPLGELRTARMRMSFGATDTSLWVASRNADFPSATQRTYLVAAASLASTGLETARLTAERERADRAKDEFLAMLAHELRNPLAPITTALDLMRLKNAPEVAYERDIIARQVRHLTRLVDDLLDIARVARGKIELRRERVAVRRLIAEAVETAHPVIEQRRHTLRIDLPAETIEVDGDAERLKQVVANLLSNAAKYTEPGGRIAVSAHRAGARLVLAVRDNGIGIDPDLLPRVFDLFSQGRTTADRAAGGLGIGLALVKTLVELHGGSVRAESAGTGAGSAFTVELPAARAAPGAAPEAAASASNGAPPRERILVVDDNRDAAASLALLLRALGHEVRAANDGVQALAITRQFPPTVALLDLGLPNMDGFQLAARLKEQLGIAAPRLIAVTGYGQAQDRARTAAAGFAHHVTKPVQLEVLLQLLGREKP